ncbi:MAG: hypothetical protein H7175_26570 [Burkholderiales bacterium]|nr:hypothetical protein [Anaerolineae bacterium]
MVLRTSLQRDRGFQLVQSFANRLNAGCKLTYSYGWNFAAGRRRERIEQRVEVDVQVRRLGGNLG